MTDFLVLYRGNDLNTAKVVACSAEPEIVQQFAAELLKTAQTPHTDPVLSALQSGKRRALRIVAGKEEQR